MKIIFFFYRLILSLRYRVRMFWTDHLKHNGPLLILPNHIALVDPRILLTYLGKYIIASPVASEKYYNLPVLKQVMDSVWTVPIWDMSAGATSEEVKAVFTKVSDALSEGKNILIYPAGQIYKQWFESIRWKQAAYNICQNIPENTKVIWIQTRGLWGSMRSKGWNDLETWIGWIFWNAFLMTLANFIFFLPRRNVHLYVTDITQRIQENRTKTLNEFNDSLESFYNESNYHTSLSDSLSDKEKQIADTMWELQEIEWKNVFVEKNHYLKHYFYFNDVKERKEPDVIEWSLKDLASGAQVDISEIPLDVTTTIVEKISLMKEWSIPLLTSFITSKNKDTPEISQQNLILDLFFDSLDLAEIKSYVQAKYNWASNPPINTLKTIWDLCIMAVGKSIWEEKLKECNW